MSQDDIESRLGKELRKRGRLCAHRLHPIEHTRDFGVTLRFRQHLIGKIHERDGVSLGREGNRIKTVPATHVEDLKGARSHVTTYVRPARPCSADAPHGVSCHSFHAGRLSSNVSGSVIAKQLAALGGHVPAADGCHGDGEKDSHVDAQGKDRDPGTRSARIHRR